MDDRTLPPEIAELEARLKIQGVYSAEVIAEMRDQLVQFYYKRLVDRTDKIWEERGYTQATMDEWLNSEHQ